MLFILFFRNGLVEPCGPGNLKSLIPAGLLVFCLLHFVQLMSGQGTQPRYGHAVPVRQFKTRRHTETVIECPASGAQKAWHT